VFTFSGSPVLKIVPVFCNRRTESGGWLVSRSDKMAWWISFADGTIYYSLLQNNNKHTKMFVAALCTHRNIIKIAFMLSSLNNIQVKPFKVETIGISYKKRIVFCNTC